MKANFSKLAFKEDNTSLYENSLYVLAFINYLTQTSYYVPQCHTSSG